MDTSDMTLEAGSGGPVAPEKTGSNPLDISGAPPSAAPLSDMMQHFGGAQDQAAARYSKMKAAVATLSSVRKEMDGLVALHDTVSQEDVVKAAGRLVASGLGAVPVAGLLADMPPDGEALQRWVQQQDQGVTVREQQAERALALTRHELGLVALRNIIGHSAESAQLSGQPQPQPQPAPDLSAPPSLEAPNA